MQPPTYREIVARLKREGFSKASQKGSHAKYVKDGLTVIINGSSGDRPTKGTWGNIKRQAKW